MILKASPPLFLSCSQDVGKKKKSCTNNRCENWSQATTSIFKDWYFPNPLIKGNKCGKTGGLLVGSDFYGFQWKPPLLDHTHLCVLLGASLVVKQHWQLAASVPYRLSDSGLAETTGKSSSLFHTHKKTVHSAWEQWKVGFTGRLFLEPEMIPALTKNL